MESVCIFCGSRSGERRIYELAARGLGEAIARRGLRLVYGGGKTGLMGVIADAALACGGEVIGVMPDFLLVKEIAHTRLSSLRIVGSMHERKMVMAEVADAFITLPGGYGTMDEFFEMLTWSQLGLHRKPHGLLNADGYYDPLIQLFERFEREGFIDPALRSLVLEARNPAHLLDLLAARQSRVAEQWRAPLERV
jgi:uncharacterized protein (TIGR00730 family)